MPATTHEPMRSPTPPPPPPPILSLVPPPRTAAVRFSTLAARNDPMPPLEAWLCLDPVATSVYSSSVVEDELALSRFNFKVRLALGSTVTFVPIGVLDSHVVPATKTSRIEHLCETIGVDVLRPLVTVLLQSKAMAASLHSVSTWPGYYAVLRSYKTLPDTNDDSRRVEAFVFKLVP